MSDLHKRTLAIQQLKERFAAEAPALTKALVSDRQLAEAAAPPHVVEATQLIGAWLVDSAAAVHPQVRSGQRQAAGAVAISVHDDAPLTSLARTLPAAVLAGARQCVVNLPQQAEQTAAVLRRICRGIAGLTVGTEPSSTFILRALADPYIRTIWVGGSEDLLAPFDDLICDTRSHIILEGHGNDAIVVGPDADLTRAARAAARMVFRSGGLDPAAPARVYVHAGVHDAFTALLRRCLRTDAPVPPRGALDSNHIDALIRQARQAGAELSVGRKLRAVIDHPPGPMTQPTILSGCRGDLRIVTTRCRGPILPVVPYSDDADLFTALDRSAGPDGQVGAAATLFGAPALADGLGRRFAHLLRSSQGPFGMGARRARICWGGGPTSWSLTAGPDGMRRRYGPVDLTHAFTRNMPTSRARWSSRRASRQEAAAAAK